MVVLFLVCKSDLERDVIPILWSISSRHKEFKQYCLLLWYSYASVVENTKYSESIELGVSAVEQFKKHITMYETITKFKFCLNYDHIKCLITSYRDFHIVLLVLF